MTAQAAGMRGRRQAAARRGLRRALLVWVGEVLWTEEGGHRGGLLEGPCLVGAAGLGVGHLVGAYLVEGRVGNLQAERPESL